MTNTEKLIEIKSLHEQREMIGNPDIVIKPGVWIEVLSFDPMTEKVKVRHRWQVERIDKREEEGKRKYKITCKKLDIEQIESTKENLAKEVLEKHKEKLKASFVKCLVDGISIRTVSELKEMLNKLGGENDKQKDN